MGSKEVSLVGRLMEMTEHRWFEVEKKLGSTMSSPGAVQTATMGLREVSMASLLDLIGYHQAGVDHLRCFSSALNGSPNAHVGKKIRLKQSVLWAQIVAAALTLALPSPTGCITIPGSMGRD